MPIMPTCGGRADEGRNVDSRQRFIGVGDIAIFVNVGDDVLITQFFVPEELASFTVQVPENSMLSDLKESRAAIYIHQYALVNFVQVVCFAWGVLVIPDYAAIFWIKSQD